MAVIALLVFGSFKLAEVLPIGSEMPKADLKMKDVSGKDVSMKDALK